MSEPYFMGDFMFQIVPVFIGIIFIIVIGSIVFAVFNGIGQWRKNEQSPKLSVPANVKYGLLSENDIGMLTFQGTRYLGFEREKVRKDNL